MLGTSHQLLKHYLDGLEKWRYKERYRMATEESDQIFARAIVEGRPMTQSEEQRSHVCAIAVIRAKASLSTSGICDCDFKAQSPERGCWGRR
jgi:hypothetical protein